MRKKVLILDNESRFATGLAEHCRTLGLAVATAQCLHTAVWLAEQHPPDLICLASETQSGNGLELYERLSRERPIAGTPTVILSGNDQSANRSFGQWRGYYVDSGGASWTTLQAVICDLLDQPSPPVSPNEGVVTG